MLNHKVEIMPSVNYIYLETFIDTLVEYFRNSSVPGYKYLIGRNKYERLFWFVVHSTLLIVTYFLWTSNWTQFTRNPTITIVETYSYPITKVEMPSVSVCPINKITLSRALNFAEMLANKSGKPSDEIFDYVKLFGRFYDYSLSPEDQEKLITFDNFLEMNDFYENGIFDTHRVLQSLHIPCDKLLSHCKWRGKSYQCEDLFVSQLTGDGYCCVFNYVSILSTVGVSKVLLDNNMQPLKGGATSKNGGLTFKAYSNKSDYFYPTISTVGIKLIFSLPTDFPDMISGTEKVIGESTEAFLRIRSITTYSTEEVRKHAVEKRNCVFHNEQRTPFGVYSLSNCYMSCKIDSIIALCNCIPFNYVHVFPNETIQQCTLSDLLCVSKFYVKFNTMYPTGAEKDELLQEKQNSLQCNDECMPACSDTIYKVSSETSSMESEKDLNYSVVHVYFDNPFGVLNQQDTYFYWFDILGLFGGLCSLIMGISIVNVIEIVYFFSYRYYTQLRVNISYQRNTF